MSQLTQQHVSCPYCGESIEVLIDQEEEGQQYIEDCQV
ncbi:MAG: CPXCG motif-containing cysteine-rich protein, partial [Anaerolineae bacterium]|nr:CPXCG motif-containing cysteine-rich protein [Anaerolineae bacterium]